MNARTTRAPGPRTWSVTSLLHRCLQPPHQLGERCGQHRPIGNHNVAAFGQRDRAERCPDPPPCPIARNCGAYAFLARNDPDLGDTPIPCDDHRDPSLPASHPCCEDLGEPASSCQRPRRRGACDPCAVSGRGPPGRLSFGDERGIHACVFCVEHSADRYVS